jgi:hypothetical protein
VIRRAILGGIMIPYRDWDRDSGVQAYEIGEAHIDVQFKSGAVYRYTSASVGASNLKHMVALAQAGDGLNSFINKSVRQNYSARLS